MTNYESRSISLLYHKYGEGSIIAKIFTEEYGLKSFDVKRSRSKKSKKKTPLLEKLSLVNISAKNIAKKEIQYLGEINLAYGFKNNSLKNKLIRIFISEVLSKILIDSEKDIGLFQFIWELSIDLDKSENVDDNFCINFLISLSEFLGFYPSIENIHYSFFNLNNSVFTEKEITTDINIKGDNLTFFRELITKKKVTIPYANRQELIENLFFYYSTHHYNLNKVSSHKIIESLR
jgi:DNA repair protein RecO (recombination protein O)